MLLTMIKSGFRYGIIAFIAGLVVLVLGAAVTFIVTLITELQDRKRNKK